MNTIFFAEFSQRQYRWSFFKELDRDEYVHFFHADHGHLGCVDRPIRRDHRRGSRDTLTVSNSFGDKSTLLIICITRIN